MLVPFNNFYHFSSAEEFYSLFLFLKKELDIDVLDWNEFKSYYFFYILKEKDYIDRKYLEKIKDSLGGYFLGENNKRAILDSRKLIDFIYERESLSGKTKEQIEDFFLYHIALMLELDSSSSFEKSMIHTLNQKFKDLGLLDSSNHKIDIVLVPKETRNMKLNYFNLENVFEKIDYLENLIEDKNCLEVLKNIKEQLTD